MTNELWIFEMFHNQVTSIRITEIVLYRYNKISFILCYQLIQLVLLRGTSAFAYSTVLYPVYRVASYLRYSYSYWYTRTRVKLCMWCRKYRLRE